MSAPRFLAFLAACVLLPAAALAAPPDALCADCHGKDGASTESDIPVIAGQSAQYLTDAMTSYRDRKRPCPETKFRSGDAKRAKTDMCQIAAKLSADDTAKVVKDL